MFKIKYWTLSLLIICLSGCNKHNINNDEVVSAVDKFYTSFNKENFKELQSVCTDNLYNDFQILKQYKKEIVKCKSYDIMDCDISGDNAVVTIAVTDEFNNIVEQTWELVKTSDGWKFNSYNHMNSSDISNKKKNNTPDKTIKSTETSTETSSFAVDFSK